MAEITTSNGYSVLLDDEDYVWAAKSTWRVYLKGPSKVPYADAKIRMRMVSLHREVARLAGLDVSGMIDHANGNSLDNRRSNLRPATACESNQNRRKARSNTSGFKGVSYHAQSGKYQVRIWADGKEYALGLYVTAEEAHDAYCGVAPILHGKFHRLG